MKKVFATVAMFWLAIAVASLAQLPKPGSGGGSGTTYSFSAPITESGGTVACATCSTFLTYGTADPDSLSFTEINTPGLVQTNNTAYIETADNLRAVVVSVPGAQYTLRATVAFRVVEANFQNVGLVWRQSSDGKLATCGIAMQAGQTLLASQTWTSPTVFNATYASINAIPGDPVTLQIQDNGTSRICSWCPDGQNCGTIHSVARTDFLTADQIGFFVEKNTTTHVAAGTLLQWMATAP